MEAGASPWYGASPWSCAPLPLFFVRAGARAREERGAVSGRRESLGRRVRLAAPPRRVFSIGQPWNARKRGWSLLVKNPQGAE